MDAIYRLSHSLSSIPSALAQALLLIYNLTVGTPHRGEGGGGTLLRPQDPRQQYGDKNDDDTGRRSGNRFYRALYSVLLDTVMLSGRRNLTIYLNLIFKVLKNNREGKDENYDDHNDGVGNGDGGSKEAKEEGGGRAQGKEGETYPPAHQQSFLSGEGRFGGGQ